MNIWRNRAGFASTVDMMQAGANFSGPPGSADAGLAGGRLTIDLLAIGENYDYLAKLAPSAETAAALKADAYGLGLEPVAQTLAKRGCRTFFTALPIEGVRLRKIDTTADIYVLGGIWPEVLGDFSQYNLRPVLNTNEDIALWCKAYQANLPPFALHFDTGINRLGLPLSAAGEYVTMKPSLVMSHLACADEPAHTLNNRQLAAFSKIAGYFPHARMSLANSAGIFGGSDYHFDVTRPGIALYGGEARNNHANPMRAVINLAGRVLQIRTVIAGDTIGYGATHVFSRDSRVAIVAIGYGDGYHRANSGSGTPLRPHLEGSHGMYQSRRLPVVGRISMDVAAFDVSRVPNGSIRQGDWIELINSEITVDDVARSSGTIGYEILTSLGHRYARSYING